MFVDGVHMRDVLKTLDDLNPADPGTLERAGLRRFEALCGSWANITGRTSSPRLLSVQPACPKSLGRPGYSRR